MKRTFCYVLSGEYGNYVDFAAVSTYALIRFNPDAHVEWVCDFPLSKTPPHIREFISEHGIQCKTVDTPFTDPIVSSRYLKTSLTEFLAPPFVFLDCDTLPIASLDSLFSEVELFDVAAALDGESVERVGQPGRWVEEDLMQVATLRFHPVGYLNTGVMVFSASDVAREFCSRWSSIWHRLYEQHQVAFDQPSFNSALRDVDPTIRVLSRCNNALVNVNPGWARNSKIMHFCTSNHTGNADDKSVFGRLFAEWSEQHSVDDKYLLEIARRKNPYCTTPDSVRANLLVRDYPGAFRAVVRRIFKSRRRLIA